MQLFSQTLHPERYHGRNKTPPFFEGWYFKLVDTSETHRFAIIPGVSLNEGGEGPHAFVQILDGASGLTAYHQYELDDFWAAQDAFDITIGPNRFSTHHIALDIAQGPLSVQGDVQFTNVTGWPVTPTSPGIMGWYAWVPFMECYHGVLSFDHTIQGTLRIDGMPSDFSGGRGYIEKDWGKAFPSAWVWQQTNHFETPGVCLTASIAMIPWIGQTFRGFIVGLWHNGILYRFATYTGARTEQLTITDEQVRWIVTDRLYRLEMLSQRSEGGELRGPSIADMRRRVPETLNALVQVRLTTRHEGKILFEGTGRNAGLEVAGELEKLLADSPG
ncbi:MAG: hypothetical protein JXB35_04200 [Anaerolineae bacterium]|nr:hypothetical protein [Anaerolineae bacterium]